MVNFGKTENAVEKFFSSDYFIAAYAIFVYGFSFVRRGEITLTAIVLIFSLLFFTQRNLKCTLTPFVLSYFSLPFLKGGFALGDAFYMSLAVLLCSILCYAARNKARIKFTYNLKALLPYAAAYPLGGLLVTGYFENKVYIEGLGLLAMLTLAFLLLALIAANTYLNDKDYVLKLIAALGAVVSLQIFTLALSTENFTEVMLSDTVTLNWGIYNGVVTVMLFAIPACFYFARKRPNSSLLFMILAFAELITCFLTASRAAIIFMPVYTAACLIITLCTMKKGKLKLLTSFAEVLTLLIMAFVIAYLFNRGEIREIIDCILKMGLNGNGRLPVWKDSWKFFLENPIFGNGLLHHNDLPQGNAAGMFWMSHNTVLQALSSLGIVGLLTLLIHTAAKYKSCAKKNTLCFYVLIMFIGTELYGLIDCVMPAPYYAIPLVALLITLDIKDDLPIKK